MAPYPATTIANEFLRLAKRDGVPLTHMKLQKLVYIAHGWHLTFSDGEPLIEERVQAWDYGPVINEMYAAFAKYGKDDIDEQYWTFEEQEGRVAMVHPMIDDEDGFAHEVIRNVWDTYGKFTAYQLSALTHREGTPWHKANRRGERFISEKAILGHFRELASA